MKVIFNADDFGYSKAVNYGIIESFKCGVVRSASILVNTVGFEHALSLYNENKEKGFRVGIHLNIMMGTPICKDVSTLINDDGRFYKYSYFENSKTFFDDEEIEKEFTAQIEKAYNAGIELTHIDSHYGIHTKQPIFNIAAKLAQKYNLPMRMTEENRKNNMSKNIKSAECFTGGFFAQNASLDYIVNYLSNIKCNTVEILCRPAYLDLAIYKNTRYSLNRMNELEILCSDDLKRFIKNGKFELINYSQI